MVTIKDFKTIIKPIITEKSSMGAEYNQVTFQVQKTSSKKEIKLAVENIFKVKVKKIKKRVFLKTYLSGWYSIVWISDSRENVEGTKR